MRAGGGALSSRVLLWSVLPKSFTQHSLSRQIPPIRGIPQLLVRSSLSIFCFPHCLLLLSKNWIFYTPSFPSKQFLMWINKYINQKCSLIKGSFVICQFSYAYYFLVKNQLVMMLSCLDVTYVYHPLRSSIGVKLMDKRKCSGAIFSFFFDSKI